MNQKKLLNDYSFELPLSLIAQSPARPRDSAKLLVYERENGSVAESTFNCLTDFIGRNSVLVFNNTKVIPVRIMGRRKTGGIVEIFFLKALSEGLYQVFLSRRLAVGEILVLRGGKKIEVVRQEEKYFVVSGFSDESILRTYLTRWGTMPTPPYIKNPPSHTRLKADYQTVFARIPGSIAAPTASLHFTKRLLNKLEKHGIPYYFITLHVGLGTFAPLTVENFKTNSLHRELYEVKQSVWKSLLKAKQAGKKIIAVGTTTVRTLETVAQSGKLSGETSLFITPGFRFRMVEGLITNFHLPRSSLLFLVSAFVGNREKTLALYERAIARRYRFYSFGDGMLIK